jgi:hypothetical protein
MKKENKFRLARWTAILAVILGLRFIGGGRTWEYMENHLLLTCVLPLVVLVFVLFVRGMTTQRWREPADRAKVGSAQSAKP